MAQTEPSGFFNGSFSRFNILFCLKSSVHFFGTLHYLFFCSGNNQKKKKKRKEKKKRSSATIGTIFLQEKINYLHYKKISDPKIYRWK